MGSNHDKVPFNFFKLVYNKRKNFMKKNYKFLPIVLLLLFGCQPNKKNGTPIPNINISSIVVDNSNTKWVGTDNGLYKSVDNGYTLEDISIPGKVLSIFYEKSSNTLWVGSIGGLSKVVISGSDISSSVITSINLSDSSVQTAYVDSTSKRWFGAANGLSLNKNTTWKNKNFIYNALNNLVPMDIEKASINSIASWNGDYYFATNGYSLYRAKKYNEGVDAFTGATQWSSPYNGNSVTDTMFVVFVDSKGKIWMGGANGVQFHTGHDSKSNTKSFRSELPNLYVHAIAEAPDGKIWVGTEQGLAIYDGVNWTAITNGLSNLFVTAIAFDKNGSAWVGTKMGLVNIKK